ncbi:hypothetical protein F2Q69_00062053 [Brassica cretica]|uniref:Transmembrane protein n=1 Tax=Brassica cretica TaxID=69181 RepID=A0A8S9REG4_BRACR|nr:hypothetical protein F2Q69_00062053 [Brassica cretica]
MTTARILRHVNGVLSLPVSIPEAESSVVRLDAGKASGRRRRVFLSVVCSVLLCSCLFVTFSYGFCVLAVSYGPASWNPLEALYTRTSRLLVPAEFMLGSQPESPLFTAVIVHPSSTIGAALFCGSKTTRSTHPECWLARSEGFCVSEVPPHSSPPSSTTRFFRSA